MARIQFTKMHGCGNDYVYVNTMLYDVADPSALARRLAKPHFGIGSDGLILIGEATEPGCDFSMRIFNADGSEALMCGNGARCVARYLHDKHYSDSSAIRLQTLAGTKILRLNFDADGRLSTVTVDMGEPQFADSKLFISDRASDVLKDIRELQVPPLGDGGASLFVSMGNPHFVIFAEAENIDEIGKNLEFAPCFPQRANIELARVASDGSIRMRVWERGSGITLACGTGASATAVAAAKLGLRPRESEVEMDGGRVLVSWDEATNHVFLTGPATHVFDGEIDI